MAMCAGVQNVSRPIDRCQETSQCAPIETEVTATTEHHRYQGIEVTGFDPGTPAPGADAFQVVAIAIESPATILLWSEI